MRDGATKDDTDSVVVLGGNIQEFEPQTFVDDARGAIDRCNRNRGGTFKTKQLSDRPFRMTAL